MIGVVVCRTLSPTEWEIDTWLMSCRVLGRCVEQAVLREIVQSARARGVRLLIGVYRPTERNGLVRDHYQKLGFAPLEASAGGETRWHLSTQTEITPAPMTVVRSGFESTSPV